MSQRTVFLARLIGLFALLIDAAVLVRGSELIRATIANESAQFTLALFSVAIGLAIVLTHNIWKNGTLPIVVTIVGWLILVKGLSLLFVPTAAFTALVDSMALNANLYFYISPSVLLGLYLTYAGFSAEDGVRTRA